MRSCLAAAVRRGIPSTTTSQLQCPVLPLCRGFCVRFQETPNESCYKFLVDGMQFIPNGTPTTVFDRDNAYQSPLAHQILEALPMVEDVTVSEQFVTVRRVETPDAATAARIFAAHFRWAMAADSELQAAAAHSEALQKCLDDAAHEGSGATTFHHRQRTGRPGPVDSDHSCRMTEGDTLDIGGFSVMQDVQVDDLDETALRDLIAATTWSELRLHVSALLTDHLYSGAPHIALDTPHPNAQLLPQPGDTEVVLMIKELLVADVQPQLHRDGGDLRFVEFDSKSGRLDIEMLGACRSCKSSGTTLLDLIERTVRHWIPEVSNVTEVRRRATAVLGGRPAELEKHVVHEVTHHPRVVRRTAPTEQTMDLGACPSVTRGVGTP